MWTGQRILDYFKLHFSANRFLVSNGKLSCVKPGLLEYTSFMQLHAAIQRPSYYNTGQIGSFLRSSRGELKNPYEATIKSRRL